MDTVEIGIFVEGLRYNDARDVFRKRAVKRAALEICGRLQFHIRGMYV